MDLIAITTSPLPRNCHCSMSHNTMGICCFLLFRFLFPMASTDLFQCLLPTLSLLGRLSPTLQPTSLTSPGSSTARPSCLSMQVQALCSATMVSFPGSLALSLGISASPYATFQCQHSPSAKALPPLALAARLNSVSWHMALS